MDGDLKRVLTFENLLGFGIVNIMGSGGFNLIGDAVISGGPHFPLAIAATSALFQGTSLTYQEAYNAFKTNTSESDLIQKEFGSAAATASAAGILAFNLISTSTVLVICAKLLFPAGSWTGQISFAILLLLVMTLTSLKGIELNRHIITIAGIGAVSLLSFAALIGLVEIGTRGLPTSMPTSIGVRHNFIHSILYFYFILAGFDALMKFAEESKDPDRDLPRSFYASNAISTLLTVGVCIAFLAVFTTNKTTHDENVVAKIVGAVLGSSAEKIIAILSIALMIISAFVTFLASSRYMFSASEKIKGLEQLRDINEAKAPWKTIVVVTILIMIGILINNVYELVKFSDIALTVTLLLVSAAATKMQIKGGRIPFIELATTVGLIALLSACIIYP
jgi:APA family basic amino acid/polyamine antiporter